MNITRRAMHKLADDWIPTRQTLLSRLRDWDDQASWEEFFQTYWRLIYHVALRSGLNDAEAQDVVQETVITVAKQMPTFRYDRAKGSFKGWLLRTTQWRIHDQFRKRLGHVPLREPAGTTTEIEPSPGNDQQIEGQAAGVEDRWDELWEENLLAVAIERVKQRVDPRDFQVFDLLVHRTWPALKVADRLNVTRARVYYARHKIARLIRREMGRLERRSRRK